MIFLCPDLYPKPALSLGLSHLRQSASLSLPHYFSDEKKSQLFSSVGDSLPGGQPCGGLPDLQLTTP